MKPITLAFLVLAFGAAVCLSQRRCLPNQYSATKEVATTNPRSRGRQRQYKVFYDIQKGLMAKYVSLYNSTFHPTLQYIFIANKNSRYFLRKSFISSKWSCHSFRSSHPIKRECLPESAKKLKEFWVGQDGQGFKVTPYLKDGAYFSEYWAVNTEDYMTIFPAYVRTYNHKMNLIKTVEWRNGTGHIPDMSVFNTPELCKKKDLTDELKEYQKEIMEKENAFEIL